MSFASVVSTPYLIRWLGSNTFGLYRIALDWLGYLTFLDLGLNETLIPILMEAHGTAEAGRVIKALVACFRAYLLTLPIKLIAGIAFVALSPYFIHSPETSLSDLRWGLLLGVGASLFSPLQPFRTLLEVKQVGYRVHKALLYRTLLTISLSLALSYEGYGIRGQFVAALLGDLLFHFMISVYALSHYPGLVQKLFIDAVDAKSWKAIWHLNIPNFVSNICSRISYMTDNIIIVMGLTIDRVTPFIVTQRLITFANLHLFGIGNATWSALAHLHARGNLAIFQKRFLELNRLIVVAGLVTLGPIAALNQAFLTLWLGPSFYGGDTLSALASINSILLALISFWGWIFSAKGIAKKLIAQYVAYSLVNFALSIGFTKVFGIYGPLLGTFCAIFSVSFWVIPQLLKRHFHIPPSHLYEGMVQPFTVLLPAIALIWIAARRFPPQDWTTLAFLFLMSCLMLSLLVWRMVFSDSERKLWGLRVLQKMRVLLR
jgi:O-antigen/teichoic acid export membrane protein